MNNRFAMILSRDLGYNSAFPDSKQYTGSITVGGTFFFSRTARSCPVDIHCLRKTKQNSDVNSNSNSFIQKHNVYSKKRNMLICSCYKAALNTKKIF